MTDQDLGTQAEQLPVQASAVRSETTFNAHWIKLIAVDCSYIAVKLLCVFVRIDFCEQSKSINSDEEEEQTFVGGQMFQQAPHRESVIFFSTGKKLFRARRIEKQESSAQQDQQTPFLSLHENYEKPSKSEPTTHTNPSVQPRPRGNTHLSRTTPLTGIVILICFFCFRPSCSKDLLSDFCSGDAAEAFSSTGGAASWWRGGHIHLAVCPGSCQLALCFASLWKPTGLHFALWRVHCEYSTPLTFTPLLMTLVWSTHTAPRSFINVLRFHLFSRGLFRSALSPCLVLPLTALYCRRDDLRYKHSIFTLKTPLSWLRKHCCQFNRCFIKVQNIAKCFV